MSLNRNVSVPVGIACLGPAIGDTLLPPEWRGYACDSNGTGKKPPGAVIRDAALAERVPRLGSSRLANAIGMVPWG